MTETSASVPIKSKGNAKTTNDPLSLPYTDGRGPWQRRRRDLIRQLTAEVGGSITTHQRALVSNAAAAILASEKMQARLVNGEMVPADDVVRISNLVTRLLAALSKGHAKSQAPSLQTYLASRPLPAATGNGERTSEGVS